MAANGSGLERNERADGAQRVGAIYNWMSVTGAAFAAIGLSIAAFLVVIDFFTKGATGYAGLALLPPMLFSLFGCGLIVVGYRREKNRQRRGEHSRFVDNWIVDPLRIVRNVGPVFLLLGLSGATLALVSAGAGSVAVVKFSESNTFCGDVCHAVMSPQATAYQSAVHSQIACVDCHVAPGAEGFLEAKLGGMRQLWAIATDSVRRPIPTPIHGNIINRELCERCHAPSREIGYKILTRHYYLSGLEDAAIELAMAVKVGGGQNGLIAGGGIHYHMMSAHKVEFISRDAQRQDIASVRVTNADGSVRDYENKSAALTASERASLVSRGMECIDCHSRPAHAFRSPIELVNEALRSKRLPNDLYYIKEAGVRALDGGYESVDEAMSGIEASLRAYYREKDEDMLDERSDDITTAAEVLKEGYRRAIFPEMKTDWRSHPNNIGHTDSPGCFRCHNDEMVDRDGKSIFTDCSGCHAILAQDKAAIETASDLGKGMGFAHPQDGQFIENFKLCSKCHTGGQELYD